MIAIEDIARELKDYIRLLDDVFSTWVFHKGVVIGTPVIPSPLLLTHLAIVSQDSYMERLIPNLYDHYILFFFEVSMVRGVRYKGKRRFDINKPFEIKKLLKQKDKTSKIGSELLGSFITEGEIENVDERALNDHARVLLLLIRPLLMRPNILIPSPLSIIVHETWESRMQRKYYLAPSIVTVIIKNLRFEKDFNVLGEKQEGAYSDSALLLAFDAKQYLIQEVRVRIFIPKRIEEQYGNLRLLRKYVSQDKPIAVGLQGVFIIECDEPVLKLDTCSGYFLVLQKADVIANIEAFGIYGEARCYELQAQKYTSQKHKLCYAIGCKKVHLENFKNAMTKYFRGLEKEGVHILPGTHIHNIQLKEPTYSNTLSKFLIERDNYVELLAPPLTTHILMDKLQLGEVHSLLKTVEMLGNLKGIEQQLSIYRLDFRTKNLLKMLESSWYKAFRVQHEFVKKRNLLYII
uniref:Uncharacterized protein n=1 Tax=Ignisphaera aggregans TaxID=334771 RepID=A0A7J2TBU7_9CREN